MTEEARKAKNEYMRQYRENNRERINAYKRKWAKENPERIRAYAKTHWEKKARENSQ